MEIEDREADITDFPPASRLENLRLRFNPPSEKATAALALFVSLERAMKELSHLGNGHDHREHHKWWFTDSLEHLQAARMSAYTDVLDIIINDADERMRRPFAGEPGARR